MQRMWATRFRPSAGEADPTKRLNTDDSTCYRTVDIKIAGGNECLDFAREAFDPTMNAKRQSITTCR